MRETGRILGEKQMLWKESAKRPVALAIACIGWGALTLQLHITLGVAAANGKSLAVALFIFIRYFTILTNLLAAVCMTACFFPRSAAWFNKNLLSPCALYMAMVGIVYGLFLASVWSPEGLQWWADVLLHDAMPVLVVLYWLVFALKGRLRWIDPLIWLFYPLGYLAVSLVLGAFNGWYPYPFVNVTVLGYPRVALNAFGLTFLCLCLGLLLVALDHAMARHSPD